MLLAALLTLGPALPLVQAQMDLATIRTRAEAGDPEALNALANLYVNGQGVPQSDTEAWRLYTQAAAAGHAAASFNLGMLTELGRGATQDPKAAFRHYLRAAEAGFAPAQFNVGNMYASGVGVAQDYFEAVLWFRQAAESGIPDAQYNLALAYETGRGLSKDEVLAQRWYRAASDQGYMRARYNLALMLEEGRGSAVDEATAAQLYRAAAEQGFGPAQNNYGIMLAEGRGGLASNFREAYAWLALAAENGVTAVGRDLVAARLQPAELAEAKARKEAIKAQLEGRPATTVASVATSPLADDAAVRQIAALTEQFNSAQAEVARLRSENMRLGGALQEMQVRSGQLEQQTARLEEIAGRAQAAPDLVAEKQALESRNAVLTSELVQYQAQLTDIRNMVARLQAENARLSQPAGPDPTVTQLRTQLDALKAERDALAGQNRDLAQEMQGLAALRTQLEEANRRLSAVAPAPTGGDDRVQFLTAENQRLNEEVRRATVELSNLHRRLRLAEERASASTGQPADDGKLSALQRQLDEERAAAAGLVAENRRLQQVAATGESAALQALRQELSAATNELGALRAEKAVLEQRLAGSAGGDARLNAEIGQLRSTLQALELKFDQIQAELVVAWKEANDKTAELDQTRRALTEAEQQTAAVKRELQTRNQAGGAESGRLSAELTQAQLELGELQGHLVTARQAAEEMRVQLQATEDDAAVQLNRVRGQLETTQQKLAAAEQGRQQWTAEQAALTAQVENLRRENSEMRKARTGADDASARLKSLESTLAETRQAASRDQQRLTGELNAARLRLTEAERFRTEQQQQAASLEEANQKLTGELTKVSARLATLNESHASLQQEGPPLQDKIRQLQVELRAAQARLLDGGQAEAALNERNQRLTEENLRLATENQRLLASAAQVQADDDTVAQLSLQLDAAARTLEDKDQSIAILNERVASLREDLVVSEQAIAAALAAQADAARAMPELAAMNLEIETLRDQLRRRETQLETDQKHAAVELARLAEQLQLSRQANRALADANRALLTSQSSADAMTAEEEQRLNARVRELTAAAEKLTQERNEFRAQVEEVLPRLTAAEQDVARFRRELETTRAQAASSQAEMSALQGRFAELDRAADTQGSSVAELTGLNDRLTREKQALQTQLNQAQRQAEQAQNDATLLRTRLEASERLGEIQKAGVSDLTSTNEKLEEQIRTLNAQLAQAGSSANRATEFQTANRKLEEEQAALRRQLEDLSGQVATLRAENSRLAQADQWRAEAESRAASLAGLTSQLTSAQRDIAALRAENVRLNENIQLAERDRQNRVAALQQENAAISARLRQAQSTLEQIASAARLINPAAGAPGGAVPTSRPAAETPAPAARMHTVVDGDSLSRISLRYYGTPNRWQEIYDANREALAGANVLRPGQQLRIP